MENEQSQNGRGEYQIDEITYAKHAYKGEGGGGGGLKNRL